MDTVFCYSSIYALADGQIQGSTHTKGRFSGLVLSGFRSGFLGLAGYARLRSRVEPENTRSYEKVPRKRILSWRNVQTNGQDSHQDTLAKPDIAILLEVEGVLFDVAQLDNRHAFNVAFQKLGLDCANWTQPIYIDLRRKAGGNEERMLVLFFERIGWPTSLPTDEKEPFLKNVLQEKRRALEDYVTTSSLSLRPGIDKFMDDALEAGIPLIVLAAYSRNGEEVARSVVERLGSGRMHSIKIVGQSEIERSIYGQVVLGKGVSAGLDERLANEAARAIAAEKQRVAEEVASILKLSVEIDTSSHEIAKKVIATLRAGAEYAGMPIENCILLSGSQTGVLAAERIGMPCVVVRSRVRRRLIRIATVEEMVHREYTVVLYYDGIPLLIDMFVHMHGGLLNHSCFG